jgi:hypothetical protein
MDECPLFNGRLSVVYSATATFFAPSDECGAGGMRREIIRSTPNWRRSGPRYDCVYVVHDPELPGFRGLHVARVRLFFTITYEEIAYPCALVSWFLPIGDQPCPQTGMWMVKPEVESGDRPLQVIHVDSILRSAHLLGIPGDNVIHPKLRHTMTLDVFNAFYVNKYADHHAHELAF